MNMIALWTVLFLAGLCALVWFLFRSGQVYAKWLEQEEPKESFRSSYKAFLKAPFERRRAEKEEARKRLEALPVEERGYVNPYGKALLRDTLLLLLAMILAALLILLKKWLDKGAPVGGSWDKVIWVLLGSLLLSDMLLLIRQLYRVLVAALAFGKYRSFKKRNPGKAYDIQYFWEQSIADNGAYRPEDFGRKR
jgi:hypothetical protein